MDKITISHLERRAYVYVRQSTPEQVQSHLESQRLQYRLAEYARELGWKEVSVIDNDLGRSASSGQERVGFTQLMSEVCEGRVGAIFALEASRLARTKSEWHTLIEFCAIVDVLIIDPEGIYDPKLTNDRLLLGIKGTLSEMEVAVFQERSRAARWEKARRGELYTEVAIGYVRTCDGGLEQTPDRRIRESIMLVFKKFRELGSMRQVTIWFQQEHIKLPSRDKGEANNKIQWKEPSYSALRSILTNPVYAGAYVYGRREKQILIENGRKKVRWSIRKSPDDWALVIHDHHAGYITWEEYIFNLNLIAHNTNMKGAMVIGSVKKGEALLAGLLRCGQCGRKAHVSYRGNDSDTISYNCRNKLRTAETFCGSYTERRIARAICSLVLETISPLGLEASLAAIEKLQMEDSEVARQRALDLEQSRYECERIRRQYDEVEPENRLVASELEKRWEASLAKVNELQQKLDAVQQVHPPLSKEVKDRMVALGQDLPTVWNDPRSSIELKKRILRAVIKEIVVYPEQKRIRLMVHWQGDGIHSELVVSKHQQYGKKADHDNIDVVDLMRELARIMPDKDIANLFNRLGYFTATGNTWTQTRVYNQRYRHEIEAYRDGERQERGELNLSEASVELGLHARHVKQLINQKLLPARQACRHAPWIILREDLSKDSVRKNIKHLKMSNPSPLCDDQITMKFQ